MNIIILAELARELRSLAPECRVSGLTVASGDVIYIVRNRQNREIIRLSEFGGAYYAIYRWNERMPPAYLATGLPPAEALRRTWCVRAGGRDLERFLQETDRRNWKIYPSHKGNFSVDNCHGCVASILQDRIGNWYARPRHARDYRPAKGKRPRFRTPAPALRNLLDESLRTGKTKANPA